jgi:hypothetical protein
MPIEGSISYKELSAVSSMPESQLRRLLRNAMANRIFREPENEQVAHSAGSRLLVEDRRMDSWVYFLTDHFWLVTGRSVDGFRNGQEAKILKR